MLDESRLDQLYAGPPADFTTARNRLAAELKDAGDADAAKTVKALKRPTKAAALLNRLSLAHPAEVGAALDAGAKLRALEGKLGSKGAGEKLRAASESQRDAIAAVVELASAEGHGDSPAIVDKVGDTLHAAAAEKELAKTVRAGRLEREQRGATLTVGFVTDTDAEPNPDPAGLRTAQLELRRADRDAKAARRKEERAEAGLERARTQLEHVEEMVRAARIAREGAEAELERAQRQLDELERG